MTSEIRGVLFLILSPDGRPTFVSASPVTTIAGEQKPSHPHDYGLNRSHDEVTCGLVAHIASLVTDSHSHDFDND
jgi:hypothetical protein